MAEICICGLDEMPNQVRLIRPSHLMSLVPPEQQPPTPAALPAENHLRVAFHDATEPDPDWILPDRHHIESLLQFVESWPRVTPLLLHCVVGISRSPAAAIILLTALAGGREREAVDSVRGRAPHCRPNLRMIELADGVLQRGGALTRVVRDLSEPDYSRPLPDLVRIPLL